MFLAAVSHEIRTPLNAILGMTRLLLEDEDDDDKHRRLAAVHTSGKHLLSLINDLLDLSKAESGRIDLESVPFGVDGLVDDVLEMVAVAAASKRLSIRVQIEPDVPAGLIGDQGRLRQVLLNLVGNAIKFTHEGHVQVRVAMDGPRIRFEVSDTGTGIPDEMRGSLFNPFMRSPESRRVGGAGLGLTISRHIVQAMGGELRYVPGNGSGATFVVTVRLPEARLERPHDLRGIRGCLRSEEASWLVPLLEGRGMEVSVCDDHDGCEGVLIADAGLVDDAPIELCWSEPDDGGCHVMKPVVPGLLAAAIRQEVLGDAAPRRDMFDAGLGRRHPLRILVAEDNELNRDLILEFLAAFGYTATMACDGAEAVAAAEAAAYDLILMDVEMPKLDGMEATERIRRLHGRPRIVALTAHATKSIRDGCTAAGMDDVMTKPVAPEDLAFQLRCTSRRRTQHLVAPGPPQVAAVIDRFKPRVDQMLALDGPMLINALRCDDRGAAKMMAHRMRSTVALVGLTDLAYLLASIDADDGVCHDILALEQAMDAAIAVRV